MDGEISMFTLDDFLLSFIAVVASATHALGVMVAVEVAARIVLSRPLSYIRGLIILWMSRWNIGGLCLRIFLTRFILVLTTHVRWFMGNCISIINEVKRWLLVAIKWGPFNPGLSRFMVLEHFFDRRHLRQMSFSLIAVHSKIIIHMFII